MALAAALALVVIAAGGPQPGALAAKSKPRSERPNLVVVMTDDQSINTMGAMPKVEKLLARRGVTFTNSFASNPICCPSRATYLTGQYAHSHGVWRNSGFNGGFESLDSSRTLPVWLNRAGYRTSHVGKYLNGYGSRTDPAGIPAGWDDWRGSIDGSTYRMHGYTLNENGVLNTYGRYGVEDPKTYQTDVYANKAVDFINRSAPKRQPFFLSLAPLAPHVEIAPGDGGADSDDPPVPKLPNPRAAPRHVGELAGARIERRPNFNEADVSDKPAAVQAMPPMTARGARQLDARYRSRVESLLAVDDMVANLVRTLRENGELKNTVIVFTSDNGFLLGEHRFRGGKQQVYEEAIRVPLIIRGPGIPKDVVREQPVANIDLAPTLLDLAGARANLAQDGRSLRRLIDDPRLEPGRALVVENWCQTDERCYQPETARYRGLRTGRYTYSELGTGERELYDLKRDPFQLENKAGRPGYAKRQRALAGLFDRLRNCGGGECRTAPRVKLRVGFEGRRRGGSRCAESKVIVRVAGRDLRGATRAEFLLDGEVEADGKPPFRLRVARSALRAGKPSDVSANVTVLDGRVVTVTGELPLRC